MGQETESSMRVAAAGWSSARIPAAPNSSLDSLDLHPSHQSSSRAEELQELISLSTLDTVAPKGVQISGSTSDGYEASGGEDSDQILSRIMHRSSNWIDLFRNSGCSEIMDDFKASSSSARLQPYGSKESTVLVNHFGVPFPGCISRGRSHRETFCSTLFIFVLYLIRPFLKSTYIHVIYEMSRTNAMMMRVIVPPPPSSSSMTAVEREDCLHCSKSSVVCQRQHHSVVGRRTERHYVHWGRVSDDLMRFRKRHGDKRRAGRGQYAHV
ncbi:unnamed protein product [Musa acuminata subsp. burmannicoides]